MHGIEVATVIVCGIDGKDLQGTLNRGVSLNHRVLISDKRKIFQEPAEVLIMVVNIIEELSQSFMVIRAIITN